MQPSNLSSQSCVVQSGFEYSWLKIPRNLSKATLKIHGIWEYLPSSSDKIILGKKWPFIIKAANRKVTKSPLWLSAFLGKADFRITQDVCQTHSNAVAQNTSVTSVVLLFFGFILSSTSCPVAGVEEQGSSTQRFIWALRAGDNSWCLSTLPWEHLKHLRKKAGVGWKLLASSLLKPVSL